MMQYPQVQHPNPPQPVIVSGQPQTIIVQAPFYAPTVYQQYKSKQSTALGAIQICAGFLTLLLNIVVILIEYINGPSLVGYGIWSGIIFILAGSFGIAAAKRKTKCLIITFMTLSIISAALTLVVLGLSATGWGIADRPYYYSNYQRSKVLCGIYGSMVCLALLEAVVAIWSSAICCAAVCCGSSQTQGQVIQMNPQGVQYGQAGVQSQVLYATSAPPSAGYAAMQAQPGQGTPQYMETGGYTTQPPEPKSLQDESMLPPPYEPRTPETPAEGGEMAVKTSL